MSPGETFGRWTITSAAPAHLNGKSQWLCRCLCGTERVVLAANLKQGISKSCGCHKREVTAARNSKKRKCLIGHEFGRWTVIGQISERPDLFVCRCRCGAVKEVFATNLKNGSSQSCGCLQKELSSIRSTIDLTGQVFGRLTVVYRAKKRVGLKNNFVYWACSCECGGGSVVASRHLISGNVLSCGCLQKETARRVAYEIAEYFAAMRWEAKQIAALKREDEA